MSITINDVAQLASVSKATVSAVLNNRPGISRSTRQRVLEICARLNYRPSRVARSLSVRETRSIGLVIKEIDNPFFSKVMKGVFDACTSRGYTVLLGSSELSPANEQRSISTLIQQRVDGLIVSPLQGEGVDFTYLYDLRRENYPLVTLGAIAHIPTNVVDIDNVEAAYTAVMHLAERHHRIACFNGPASSAHTQDRFEGYRRALEEKGLPLHHEDVVPAGSYVENGYDAGKALFSAPGPHPTAVFCYNDLVAFGLINALDELGLRTPDDVAVCGFDGVAHCDLARVPLTTVQVPAYEIGRTAALLLIRQIGDKESFLNERILLEARLVPRQSTYS
ncbi:LacI family DNA-binding transcriptional regulator [bacterium]|nr:LacI family DNA-binding transcriptional regulator [bacterium]